MLREYISSRNDIEKPSWLRNRMSHSITAPISVPAATMGALAEPDRDTNVWMKPQVIICTVGQ